LIEKRRRGPIEIKGETSMTIEIRGAAAAVARRALLAGVSLVAIAGMMPGVQAADLSGNLVLLNWASGSENDMIMALEQAFMKANPGVTFQNVNLTVQGDARGAIRAALQGGQAADLFVNTWPAFRKELADAGMLRDLAPLWDSQKIGDNLSASWKDLGSTDGKLYGVTYTFGDRSAMFYRTDSMKKAGIDAQPATWDEFVANFPKLTKAGIAPIAIGAKVWSHTEWFESIYEHLNGVEMAGKLAAHQIPWTDPSVKNTLKKYAELLKAGCCGDANTMLAMDWDNAADGVLKTGTFGYQMIGMWVNDRAQSEYSLKQGVDYAITQFPAMGAGHDDVSSVDTKEFDALTSGSNQPAADAFLTWITTKDAADIVAQHGLASPSNKVDPSIYGPVIKYSVDAVSKGQLQFVLGDLLPGDLVDEYRVQLQKFLQDPSDANIDAVTTALEAKAATSY
jgi:ABC-type glycerol-3-phosphate transport system substrate-binding protein